MGPAAVVNPFRQRIDQGLITTREALTAHYKTLVKQYHPDLNGASAPPVDFDRLKKHYAEAFRYLASLTDRADPVGDNAPAVQGPMTKEELLDEFRELVARGFPVNIQAAAKNRAYAASIRRISRSLGARFEDPDFFPRANREARATKRFHPKIHWYVLQIFWNLGDWRLTGYEYYRRIYRRHLAFIRESLEEEGHETLLKLLEYLTG